eukprot:1368069-Pleurochrysis_carterae.AAC.2
MMHAHCHRLLNVKASVHLRYFVGRIERISEFSTTNSNSSQAAAEVAPYAIVVMLWTPETWVFCGCSVSENQQWQIDIAKALIRSAAQSNVHPRSVHRAGTSPYALMRLPTSAERARADLRLHDCA